MHNMQSCSMKKINKIETGPLVARDWMVEVNTVSPCLLSYENIHLVK